MSDLRFGLAGRLPHRPPMLWLDELIEADEVQGVAVGRIREDNPLRLADGRLDPLAAVELVGQAAAAMAARDAGPDGVAAGGLLVGVRGCTFAARAALPGAALSVRVRRGKSWEELASWHGAVEIDGRLLAEGDFRVYTPRAAAQPPAPAAGPLPPPAALSIHPLPGRWGRVAAGRATWDLDGSFPAFHGHFADGPILPAVATCALALEPVRAALPGARLRRIPLAKFMRPIVPGERLEVTCEPAPDAGATSYQVVVRVGDAPAAALSFELLADEARGRGRPCS
jgi:3-hydroxymyristoyl/3-hydroxydecanoyl-(acyl carrier protein) dehydratase